MSSNAAIPASLAGIKRLAKKIATEKSIQHTAALEAAAQLAGYQTFLQAKRVLTARAQRPLPERPRVQPERQNTMPVSEFHLRARSHWTEMLNRVSAEGDITKTWTDRLEILEALRPFMGRNANHALLPTMGGYDLADASISSEPGCLDFHVQGRRYLTVKPRRLVLERFAADAAESFFLLELEHLEPSGVYDGERNRRIVEHRDEEVIDLGNAYYVGRDGIEEGYYDDDNGRHELPDDYRRVKRCLDGKIMLLTKGSIWNGLSSTYSAIHERLSSAEIRKAISDMIAIRDAA